MTSSIPFFLQPGVPFFILSLAGALIALAGGLQISQRRFVLAGNSAEHGIHEISPGDLPPSAEGSVP